MVQYRFALSIAIIVLIVLFSGCTGGQDITPALKELPEFQQFLKEHPNAKIIITYWSKEEVGEIVQEISQQCDKPITPMAMYKAIVSDGDLRIVSWINEENQRVLCSITEGKGLQINKSDTTSTTNATYIQTVTATITPTVTPISTVTPTPHFTPVATTISTISVPVADQKAFTNLIGMEFIQIPAGEFDMGSPSSEKYRKFNEGPVHQVKLGYNFYMGKYEVTQKQWRDIMGNSPSFFKGDDQPVEQVSWNDAQEFIKKLNEIESTDKYRLPTEAEWEYAARADTTTMYSFGNNESELGNYAWYGGNSKETTHAVGQKKPNPWGLYDMHGNVWEWVQDSWHETYDGAPSDSSAWVSKDTLLKVRRGNGWRPGPDESRSAMRLNDHQDGRYPGLGFRLVRDL